MLPLKNLTRLFNKGHSNLNTVIKGQFPANRSGSDWNTESSRKRFVPALGNSSDASPQTHYWPAPSPERDLSY